MRVPAYARAGAGNCSHSHCQRCNRFDFRSDSDRARLGTYGARRTCHSGIQPMERPMKKFLIATTALTLMCGSAFAQTSTGPGAQGDNMTKPGMTNGSMDKGSMDKGSMK